MTDVSIENLTVTRGKTLIVNDVTLTLKPGELTGLIGPNGAGKTTLMRALLGLVPHGGRSSLSRLSARDRARIAAWIPQNREVAWSIDVETLVALGRTPYLAGGRKLSPDDRHAIADAIGRMDLSSLRARRALDLSGGELARAMIARALAQDTPVILADEPVAGLDPAHQISAMKVFRDLAHQGHTILISLHDLPLASRYCGRLILLDKGRVIADGAPRDVLDATHIRGVFGIEGHWSELPGGPVFQPLEVMTE